MKFTYLIQQQLLPDTKFIHWKSLHRANIATDAGLISYSPDDQNAKDHEDKNKHTTNFPKHDILCSIIALKFG